MSKEGTSFSAIVIVILGKSRLLVVLSTTCLHVKPFHLLYINIKIIKTNLAILNNYKPHNLIHITLLILHHHQLPKLGLNIQLYYTRLRVILHQNQIRHQLGQYWAQSHQSGKGSPLYYFQCNLLLLHPRNRISLTIPRAPAYCNSSSIYPLLVNTDATILNNHSPQSPSKMACYYHIPTAYPLLCLYRVQHLPPEAQWNGNRNPYSTPLPPTYTLL